MRAEVLLRRLRQLRDEWGWTQEEASRFSGVHQPNLSVWERGKVTSPIWDELSNYLHAYGIDVETILLQHMMDAGPKYGSHRKLNGDPLMNHEADAALQMYDQGVPIDYIADRFLVSPFVIRTIARKRELKDLRP